MVVVAAGDAVRAGRGGVVDAGPSVGPASLRGRGRRSRSGRPHRAGALADGAPPPAHGCRRRLPPLPAHPDRDGERRAGRYWPALPVSGATAPGQAAARGAPGRPWAVPPQRPAVLPAGGVGRGPAPLHQARGSQPAPSLGSWTCWPTSAWARRTPRTGPPDPGRRRFQPGSALARGAPGRAGRATPAR